MDNIHSPRILAFGGHISIHISRHFPWPA